MKTFLLIICLLVTTTSARADLEASNQAPQESYDADFPDIPKNHWAYESFSAIYSIPELEKYGAVYRRPMFEQWAFTRYEFAIAVARITNIENGLVDSTSSKVISPFDAAPKSHELVDAMAALQIEFAPELKRLGVRFSAIEYSN